MLEVSPRETVGLLSDLGHPGEARGGQHEGHLRLGAMTVDQE